MLTILRTIWLGATLILLAAALLLASDLDRRNRQSAAPRVRLAVMQWSSTDLLDNTVAGILEGLRRQGFEDGPTAEIRCFNAAGDSATANALARDLTSGRYTMVFTASTLALQTVAQANRAARIRHLFGGVTDPYGAGVGITGPRPDQHPPHLVGVGTFQPVERAFRLARQLNPSLHRVGVVWNPGESNSEACLGKARGVCRELGMELIEANAGHTSEVPEAVRSVLARSVQAIWVGGDTVAISSLAAIVSAARAAGLPVFTNDPTDTTHGALFGVGASYRQVGNAVGEMGGKILKGVEPRTFGVENLVPELLSVSETIPVEWRRSWTVPDALRTRTDAATPTPQTGAPARPWEIRVIQFNEAQFATETVRGLLDGLAQQGLTNGNGMRLRTLHAQGDLTTLTSIMSAVRGEQPDLVVTVSTPALQAALRQLGGQRMVFATVADAVAAGAGRSEREHLPNVTGITTRSPFEEMARLIRQALPGVRAVGTLFCPSEINSELYRKWFAEALEREGLKLVAVALNSSAETAEASAALTRTDIQVVCQLSDNLARPGFSQIARRARDAGLPFLCFDSSGLRDGAALALARDHYHTGIEAAALALRVLQGASPADIPFTNTKTEVLAIAPELLARHGIVLPPERARNALFMETGRP